MLSLLYKPVTRKGLALLGNSSRIRMRLAANMSENSGVNFYEVIKKLNEYAPLHLAEGWDNVGLLVEPSDSVSGKIQKIMVTNDLTEKVLAEAIEEKVQLIISYHPPIFVPFKRLCNQTWKERIIIQCIENKIGIYSPHSALDAIAGGVNDWLIKALDVTNIKPLQESKTQGPYSHKVTFAVPYIEEEEAIFAQSVKNVKEFYEKSGYMFHVTEFPNKSKEVTCRCCELDVAKIIAFLEHDSNLGFNLQITKLESIPIPRHGMGRIGTLQKPLTIQTAVDHIKRYLKLSHVRLALAKNHDPRMLVCKFAACAGSGASVLKGVSSDLILTGEMSHHEVLEFNHNGASVILCDHSNTERGFLVQYSKKLQQMLGDVKVLTSLQDVEPLMVI